MSFFDKINNYFMLSNVTKDDWQSIRCHNNVESYNILNYFN